MGLSVAALITCPRSWPWEEETANLKALTEMGMSSACLRTQKEASKEQSE